VILAANESRFLIVARNTSLVWRSGCRTLPDSTHPLLLVAFIASWSFIALGDDRVTSSLFEPVRFLDCGGRGHDLRPCISNPSNQFFFRKAEMKADNLRMEFDDEVAHLVVERRPVGAWNGHVLIDPQFPLSLTSRSHAYRSIH
jgi:hypothetical protein